MNPTTKDTARRSNSLFKALTQSIQRRYPYRQLWRWSTDLPLKGDRSCCVDTSLRPVLCSRPNLRGPGEHICTFFRTMDFRAHILCSIALLMLCRVCCHCHQTLNVGICWEGILTGCQSHWKTLSRCWLTSSLLDISRYRPLCLACCC
jgi:hypothetical protein